MGSSEPFTELLAPALVAIEAEGLHIVFPVEPHPPAQRLLETLGVTWSVDPDAPALAEPTFDPNSRRPRTDEERARDAKRHRDRRKREAIANPSTRPRP